MNNRLIRFVVPVIASAGIAVGALAASASGVGASSVRPSGASGATGATTTTLVKAPPIQNRHKKQIFVYFDTVTGGVYKPEGDCQMTNIFQQGQLVVFRMWGVDVAAGGTPLTDANVKTAFVTVPGMKSIALQYAKHPTGTAYWTAPWSTTNYPLGIVNFTMTVTTKPVAATATAKAVPSYTAVFSQKAYPPPSQLTIVAA